MFGELIPVVVCGEQNMCMADLLACRGVSIKKDFNDAEIAVIKSLLIEHLNKDTNEKKCIDLKKVKLVIDSAEAGDLLWLL